MSSQSEIKTDAENLKENITVNEKHTVKAVLLRTDGVAVEIAYDASPTKNVIKEILGVSPTIIGEWKKINVVLLRGKYTSLTAPLNKHELKHPFQGRKFYGDILLYRVNNEGILDNFSLSEYERFASEKGVDVEEERVVLSGDAKEKEEKELREMNKALSHVIERQFEKRHGRKPSAWETRTLTQTVMQTISETIGEDERLEEYLDENEEFEEEKRFKKSPAGKKRKQATDQTPSKVSTGLESEEEMSEQLRREIAEAIDIIREKGRQDAHYLADLVSETFYEINGREAELQDIADVFKRVKEQLADEAKEELLDSEEERTDFVTPQKAKANKKETIQNFAQSALTAEMAEEARNKFLKENGREPSLEEFEELLVLLITSRFTETNLVQEFDSVASPSSEAKQAHLDVNKTPVSKTDASMVTPIKGKGKQAPAPSSTGKKPVKFFSPVRDQKTPKQEKVLLNSVDRKLMERAVKHFRSIYQREPTEEENKNLCKFLTTGDLPNLDSDEEKENIENANPNIKKKVMFSEEDDESDSDYVPEKDKTCNEAKDAAEESDDLSGLVNENGLVDVN